MSFPLIKVDIGLTFMYSRRECDPGNVVKSSVSMFKLVYTYIYIYIYNDRKRETEKKEV